MNKQSFSLLATHGVSGLCLKSRLSLPPFMIHHHQLIWMDQTHRGYLVTEFFFLPAIPSFPATVLQVCPSVGAKKYACKIYLKDIASSISSCFLLCVCVYVGVCARVWGCVCACVSACVHACVRACMKAKRDLWCLVPLPVASPSSFKTDRSLNLDPSCWSVRLVQCDPFVSAPQCWLLEVGTLPWLDFHTGAEYSQLDPSA